MATPDKQWKRLALTAAVGSLLAAALLWLPQPEAAPPASKAALSQIAAADRAGPGRRIDVADAPAAELADTEAPDGLEIGADQHLIVNRALHDVIDYYLLGGHPGQRPEHVTRLQTHLKGSLPAPAYADAQRHVAAYLSYLDAHDALLARQAPPAVNPDSVMAAADADRLAAWLTELSRLRQQILGVEVAKIWFGEEEAESQQMLAALRSGAGTSAHKVENNPLQQGSDGLRLLREQGATQQARRELMAQQFGEAAAQRFDRLEQEEQAWQQRYAGYRQAADRIRQQAGSAEVDRVRQIDALRVQTFSIESERMRAQALDGQPH